MEEGKLKKHNRYSHLFPEKQEREQKAKEEGREPPQLFEAVMQPATAIHERSAGALVATVPASCLVVVTTQV